MNEELIRSWNRTVKENDEVYHLGDVSLCNSESTHEILKRLNGRIHLILGNHEKSVMKKSYNREIFEWIKPYYELKVDTQLIVLCHYGFRVWNKSHHVSWNLYGHSHDSMEHEAWDRSMDVGVDSAYRILGEYRPFSYDEIAKIIEEGEQSTIDHHTGNKLSKERLL